MRLILLGGSSRNVPQSRALPFTSLGLAPVTPAQEGGWGSGTLRSCTCSFEDPLNLKRIKGEKSTREKKISSFPFLKKRDFPFLCQRQRVWSTEAGRCECWERHAFPFFQIIFGFEVTNVHILLPSQSRPSGREVCDPGSVQQAGGWRAGSHPWL